METNMNRTRAMTRRLGFAAIVVGGLVGLAACLPVPLGDPAKATADSKFVGAWHWKEDGVGRNNLAAIRKWDDRTFLIDVISYDGDLATAVPKGRYVFKAWLADVKGKTFLNMQPAETLSIFPGEKRPKQFLVSKVELAGDQLTATGVDPSFDAFKDVGTTTDLEKAVAKNMDDVKMWLKPIVARKLGQDQMEAMEKLAKKFEDMKVE
jgi:hypothetical protein